MMLRPLFGTLLHGHVGAPPSSLIRMMTSQIPREAPVAIEKSVLLGKLEENGLTKKQAQTVIQALNDVIDASVQNVQKGVVTKIESDRHVHMFRSDFADVRNELYTLHKNDFAHLKGENERLIADVEKVKARIKEETNKLQGSVRLDMNLEKGRIREESQEQESKVQDTSTKIDTEIATLRGQLQTLKFDIIKYIVGTIGFVASLFLAYLQFVKV